MSSLAAQLRPNGGVRIRGIVVGRVEVCARPWLEARRRRGLAVEVRRGCCVVLAAAWLDVLVSAPYLIEVTFTREKRGSGVTRRRRSCRDCTPGFLSVSTSM